MIKMNGHSVVFGQLVQKLRYSWVLQNQLDRTLTVEHKVVQQQRNQGKGFF